MESTGGHQGTWFRASPAMASFQNVHVLMVKLKKDSKINPVHLSLRLFEKYSL